MMINPDIFSLIEGRMFCFFYPGYTFYLMFWYESNRLQWVFKSW